MINDMFFSVVWRSIFLLNSISLVLGLVRFDQVQFGIIIKLLFFASFVSIWTDLGLKKMTIARVGLLWTLISEESILTIKVVGFFISSFLLFCFGFFYDYEVDFILLAILCLCNVHLLLDFLDIKLVNGTAIRNRLGFFLLMLAVLSAAGRQYFSYLNHLEYFIISHSLFFFGLFSVRLYLAMRFGLSKKKAVSEDAPETPRVNSHYTAVFLSSKLSVFFMFFILEATNQILFEELRIGVMFAGLILSIFEMVFPVFLKSIIVSSGTSVNARTSNLMNFSFCMGLIFLIGFLIIYFVGPSIFSFIGSERPSFFVDGIILWFPFLILGYLQSCFDMYFIRRGLDVMINQHRLIVTLVQTLILFAMAAIGERHLVFVSFLLILGFEIARSLSFWNRFSTEIGANGSS